MSGHAPPPLRGVVLDYGGVITNPLPQTMVTFCAAVDITPTALVGALRAAGARLGRSPMALLEVAGCTEEEMVAGLLPDLPAHVAERMRGRSFGELWFAGRRSEPAVLELIARLRRTGLRTGLLTNNVVEWRPLWRAQVDTEALFDAVVDSSQERIRKPEPEIYRVMLERIGLAPAECLFVDDTAENCAAAAELGMRTVHWVTREQGISEVLTATAVVSAGATLVTGGSR